MNLVNVIDLRPRPLHPLLKRELLQLCGRVRCAVHPIVTRVVDKVSLHDFQELLLRVLPALLGANTYHNQRSIRIYRAIDMTSVAGLVTIGALNWWHLALLYKSPRSRFLPHQLLSTTRTRARMQLTQNFTFRPLSVTICYWRASPNSHKNQQL